MQPCGLPDVDEVRPQTLVRLKMNYKRASNAAMSATDRWA